jgi:hypothetical protein
MAAELKIHRGCTIDHIEVAVHGETRPCNTIPYHTILLRVGSDYKIEFIDHFKTGLVITLNYCATVDFHTLQITKAHVTSFQSAVSSPVVPW